MPDILFVSLEDWDEVWRRNQFFVAEFARRAPERKVLFVGLPVDVTYDLRKRRLEALRRAVAASGVLSSPPGFPNVFLLKPTKWLPNTLGFGRAFNQWMERRQMARACRRLGITAPLLWLNPHYAVHTVGRMGESQVVYDITDDWTSLNQRERVRQQVIADDAELCRRADVVVVCSERLYAMKQGKAKALHLIPNGVEVERYRLVPDREPGSPCYEEAEAALPLPEAARTWPRPVFGYTGTLHPDRVDVELVAALAQRFPQGTVALIGPSFLKPEETACLERLPNVRLVGAVPYSELQCWMRAFDVCIVPHKVTPFTESLNPLKLFEYLAAGLPIVSTDVAGFRDYGAREGEEGGSALVAIGRGQEGLEREAAFLAAAERALAERGDPVLFARQCRARQTEAARHSWAERMDRVGALLAQTQSAPARMMATSTRRAL